MQTLTGTSNGLYREYIAGKQREYGARFDASALDQRFVAYYRTGQRIKVETNGMVVTGTVGATTGWRPCFLLMRTKRSIGSPWTLGEHERIVAVQRGREYIAVDSKGDGDE